MRIFRFSSVPNATFFPTSQTNILLFLFIILGYNNYKDESKLGEYGYKESTLEEDTGQVDAQPEFAGMPFGDSDL